MKRNLLYLFLFPILNFGQVVVDSIYIEAQFYGPFNKTKAEITLHNNSEIDSVEGRFEFQINKNAFVNDMWLEIDGEFKKASTLRRSTGQRIYQRITRKRIDPALLTGSDGNYLLRVFPFQSYQKRKVIIEYFSIVEYDALGKLKWSFSSNSQERFSQTERRKSEQNGKNTIRLNSYQPLGTKIKVNNTNLKQNVCLRSKNNDSIKKINTLLTFSKKILISLDYSSTKNQPIYFSDSTKYYQVIDTLKRVYNLDPQYIYPPEILSKIIDDVKNNKEVVITNGLYNQSINNNEQIYPFSSDILMYLSKSYSIIFNSLLSNSWLGKDSKSTIMYLTDSVRKNHLQNETIEIECPYLNNFSKYLEGLDLDISGKKKLGYLYKNLAKIVIENDERALQIWDEEIRKENESNRSFDFEEAVEPVFFTAIERMPEPIGGLDSIQTKLFYPNKILASMEGWVYVKARINSKGHVVKIQTLQGLHPVLDKIGQFSLSLTNWIPAQQRGKNIPLDFTVPLSFNSDSTVLPITSPDYHIGNAIYNLKMEKGKLILFDKNVDLNKMSTIQFLSDKYFELLINHPELLEIIYKVFYLPELDGLVVYINNNGVNESINIVR